MNAKEDKKRDFTLDEMQWHLLDKQCPSQPQISGDI
jgi:hypothetical protein